MSGLYFSLPELAIDFANMSALANWNFNPPASTETWTSFAEVSFAEGVSRRAYRAMRWKPISKFGRKAVVKEYKDSYAWAQGDWDTAVKTYEKAKEFAQKFNQASRTNYPLYIVDYDIQKVIEQSDSRTPKLGEFILVEDYLEGEFEKFISNSGWVKPKCMDTYKSMPAFAHWSWLHTNGELMITDLQGVRYSDKYVLTDPCILSTTREYGATDLALIGMAIFFMSHQCTDMCRLMGIAHKRPDMSQIEGYMRREIFSKLQVQIPTSYLSKEDYDRLPEYVKTQIRAVLTTCLRFSY